MMKTNTINDQCNPEVEEDPTSPPKLFSFTAVNRWPESEVEFLRGLGSTKRVQPVQQEVFANPSMCHNRFVRRQEYLRSYPFSKKDDRCIVTKSIEVLIAKNKSLIRGFERRWKSVSSRVLFGFMIRVHAFMVKLKGLVKVSTLLLLDACENTRIFEACFI